MRSVVPSKQKPRITAQRKVILDVVRKTTSHPTASDVYDMVRRRVPKVSLGTVYRNLEVLTCEGMIQKIEWAGTQKRFDGNTNVHYHLRCLRCDSLEDVLVDPVADIEEILRRLCNYEILGHRLEILVRCPACKEKDKEEIEN